MRSIRRPLVTGTLLAALVALPALFARPWADERFVMYMPEALVGGNPLALWSRVMREVTAFIDIGVFRPMSRLAFYLEHWLVVRTGILTGVAPSVVMSTVKIAMIALLLYTGLKTIDQYRRVGPGGERIWAKVLVLLPIVFAGSLVLINPAVHPLTLFPGLYLGTASIALLAPVWVGGALLGEQEPTGRGRSVGYAAIALYGAVLASMIELAWLGLPLALTHLVLLYAQRRGWSGWRSLAGLRFEYAFRMWVFMTAGFGMVFLPARFFIARYCAAGGCYDAAVASFGGDFFALLPLRIGSAFAPVGLLAQFQAVVRLMTRPSGVLLISFAVAVISVGLLAIAWRTVPAVQDGGGRRPAILLTAGPITIYYSVVILLGAVLSAASTGLQGKGLNPAPWRETGFGLIAWAVLISVGLAVATEVLRSRMWLLIGSILFVLTITATTVINRDDMRRVGLDAEGALHIEAGWQLVGFESSANTERCATIDGLRDLAVDDNELRKINLVAAYLDDAAENHYGRLFCDRASL